MFHYQDTDEKLRREALNKLLDMTTEFQRQRLGIWPSTLGTMRRKKSNEGNRQYNGPTANRDVVMKIEREKEKDKSNNLFILFVPRY